MGDLKELIDSINSVGILQPLIVRPMDSHFQVVCGNRRLEACKKLGFKVIPCIIKEMDDKEAAVVSLVENLQREDMDPIDEANSYKRYVEEFGWGGISVLAREIGKSEVYVSHRLALLRLPVEVQELISTRRLKPSVAKEIAWVGNKETQKKLAIIAITRNLAVRNIRARVQQYNNSRGNDSDIYMATYIKTERLLRSMLINLDGIIERTEQERELREDLMEVRLDIHQLIDRIIIKERERKRYMKNKYI